MRCRPISIGRWRRRRERGRAHTRADGRRQGRLAPAYHGYLDFYETRLAPDLIDLTFARLLDPDEPMFALVAERGGELIGIAHCILHRSTGARGDYCYLQDLFTAPAARGQGVGRALIEAVYQRADALGCARVYWHTHESNETAQRLYDKVATRPPFIQYRR